MESKIISPRVIGKKSQSEQLKIMAQHWVFLYPICSRYHVMWPSTLAM